MGLSRRDFLGVAGGVGVGVGVDRLVLPASGGVGAGQRVAFYGAHQAGIVTETQEYVQFGAFDVVSDSLEDLRMLLVRWSAAAALMAQGEPVGSVQTGVAPPVDTGEAVGLPAARLTVTFGLGPSVFGPARFGLEDSRPGPLVDLPSFAGDALVAGLCGGDLGVQVCADDPVVAFHGLHSLTRLASSVAVPRWVLAGFGRTSNSRVQRTPRNLMGFKDGTANVMAQDTEGLSQFVWADRSESPGWMVGGSYMVVRRIKMLLGGWDATGLDAQERTFGRRKLSGAPLGAEREDDPVDLNARVGGLPVIPANAHIRLANPAYNGGQRILRRGYSYVDGVDEPAGSLAGGLLFICYQRDPRVQFVPIQRRLAGSDALDQHTEHVGSAIFACPPGTAPSGFVGARLFD
jgi:deferrochelatase/peroxidase EfeB